MGLGQQEGDLTASWLLPKAAAPTPDSMRTQAFSQEDARSLADGTSWHFTRADAERALLDNPSKPTDVSQIQEDIQLAKTRTEISRAVPRSQVDVVAAAADLARAQEELPEWNQHLLELEHQEANHEYTRRWSTRMGDQEADSLKVYMPILGQLDVLPDREANENMDSATERLTASNADPSAQGFQVIGNVAGIGASRFALSGTGQLMEQAVGMQTHGVGD